ncbi:MAG: MBOAT family protein [Candidatus Fournierella pullistercoris]|uniref:MBOAT family protein n=1 Tax=Candidatus Allofournierella pullistercoris TaxID=2838597 RepID=A0A948T288_9FIRM|nr:MBOAT family protein [Candidatus Fournierella pullistercoris]
MLFSTILFLFRFLPIALGLYYLVPYKLKNFVLFVSSLIFYSWGEVRFFPVMMVLILINYCCGLAIQKFDSDPKKRKLFLILSIVGSLSMLVFFKYTNFLITSLNSLLGTSFGLIEAAMVLPLGISFYTFQTMSYTIDVYRRDVPAEKNFITFGAYVVMFPQLIAGPIVKYRDVAEQLNVFHKRYTLAQIEEGITLFVFGLAKKVLIADTVSHLWYDIIGTYSGNTVTSAGVGLANVSTPLAWLGIIAYSLQLYFDFSGYSLMGIGMGKMLGFDFPMNFNMPYISRSITEFWRRWHMTLSSWFKEYVYIPLGGNRSGLKRQIFNMFVVWTLTGIWHGADWNFVLWGFYYFVLLTIEKVFLLNWMKKGRIWPHIYTLLLVAVGWALFVGNEPGVGLNLLFQKLFIPSDGVSCLYFLRNYWVILLVAIICCTPVPLRIYERLKKHTVLKILVVFALLLLSIAYIVASTNSPFLYFRF